MGYLVRIGEAVIRTDLEYNNISLGAMKMELKEAPIDGTSVDRTNENEFGYSEWTALCQETGMHDLFFGEENGIFRSHPGAFLLSANIVERIRRRCAWCRGKAKYYNTPTHNINLGRLEWLEFWCRWAIENCKNPIIKNS